MCRCIQAVSCSASEMKKAVHLGYPEVYSFLVAEYEQSVVFLYLAEVLLQ